MSIPDKKKLKDMELKHFTMKKAYPDRYAFYVNI